MGKYKYIAPLPKNMEDAVARILELEAEAKARRESKTESMRKWRASQRNSGATLED